MSRRFTRMSKTLETIVFLALLGFVRCQDQKTTTTTKTTTTKKPENFCNSYIVLNSTFLDVSYTNITNNESDVLYTQWWRYKDHGQGNLAMTCPNGTQCGTTNQVWMNDTFPSVSEGPTFINVCYKNGTNCCAKKGTVRVENCGTFLIYFLIPQNPPVRWCFDNSLHVKLINTTEEAASSSIGLVAGAAGGGAVAVGAIGTVGTILVMRLKKKKSNKIDTSSPESNSVEKNKQPEKPANGY